MSIVLTEGEVVALIERAPIGVPISLSFGRGLRLRPNSDGVYPEWAIEILNELREGGTS